MEEEEFELIEEEKELQSELTLIQNKHKDVKLVYDKVIENLKLICKMDINNKKHDEVINHSINMNTSEGTVNDLDTSLNQVKFNGPVGPTDEELGKTFFDHLESTKVILERLYVNVGKKEFENMLKNRGENEVVQNEQKNHREKIKGSNSKNKSIEVKLSANTASHTLHTNYEYDYSDEELKEDDKKIKEEYQIMLQEYRKLVKYSSFNFYISYNKEIYNFFQINLFF